MSDHFVFADVTFVLLLVAIGIFGSLAVQSKSVKSFQFQIVMVLIVWMVGEIVEISGEMGLIHLESFEVLPSVIHMIAMIMISIVFWLRFFYAKRSGKKLVDELYE